MMSVSTREESERRLAEAMRAQAIGAGRAGFAGRAPAKPERTTDPIHPLVPARPPAPAIPAHRAPTTEPGPATGRWQVLTAARVPLLFALVGGVVLGIALALLSLLAPGVLPALG